MEKAIATDALQSTIGISAMIAGPEYGEAKRVAELFYILNKVVLWPFMTNAGGRLRATERYDGARLSACFAGPASGTNLRYASARH